MTKRGWGTRVAGATRTAAAVLGALSVAGACSTTVINEAAPGPDGGDIHDATIGADVVVDSGTGIAFGDDAATPFGDDGGPASEAGPQDDASAQADATGASDGALTSDGAVFVTPSNDGGCVGDALACDVPVGCTTSLSGVVYDPAGVNPIYGAVVFVPNDPAGAIPPITRGTHSCETCTTPIGDYVTATLTDAAGHFTLTGVPAAPHLPFVVQIGKWRREVFLDGVTACTDKALDASVTRLPRNKAEGDLPQMAVLTGGSDGIGCFLTSVGVEASEYSAPGGGGRVDVYQGSAGVGSAPGLSSGTVGDCTTASCPLWVTKASLERYDVVLLGCEGGEYLNTKPAASIQAMHDWLAEGGRAFATHFQYTWFKNGPAEFQGAATWLGSSSSTGTGAYAIDEQLPTSAAMETWMTDAGLLASGKLSMVDVGDSVSTVASTTQRLVYDSATGHTKLLALEAPAGQACGKALFSDAHLGGLVASGNVPASCGASLTQTPQGKALEYAFFALSGCASDPTQPPPLPPRSP